MTRPYAQHAQARPVRMTVGGFVILALCILLLALAVTGIVLGVIWS